MISMETIFTINLVSRVLLSLYLREKREPWERGSFTIPFQYYQEVLLNETNK